MRRFLSRVLSPARRWSCFLYPFIILIRFWEADPAGQRSGTLHGAWGRAPNSTDQVYRTVAYAVRCTILRHSPWSMGESAAGAEASRRLVQLPEERESTPRGTWSACAARGAAL